MLPDRRRRVLNHVQSEGGLEQGEVSPLAGVINVDFFTLLSQPLYHFVFFLCVPNKNFNPDNK